MGTTAEVATLSNFPADYQQRYRQERYFRDDPVVRYCADNLPPLQVGRDCLGLCPDRGRGLTALSAASSTRRRTAAWHIAGHGKHAPLPKVGSAHRLTISRSIPNLISALNR